MKYVFLYPSRVLGGAELMLARAAAHLHRAGEETAVVDAAGGKLAELAAAAGVPVIEAERGSPVPLRDAAVVTPSSHVVEVRRWIEADASVRQVFWMIHPYNNVLVPFWGEFLHAHPRWMYAVNRILLDKEYREMGAALGYLMRERSLVFMDDECHAQVSRWYRLPADPAPVFLPIPLDAVFPAPPPYRPPSGPRRIFCVGRLVDFKVHTLIHLARRLAASRSAAEVKLIVVGTGDQEGRVREALSALAVDWEMRGEVQPDRLRDVLRQEADVVVGMGTSALEGARLAIPTVSIDASFLPVEPGYRFRWLFQNTGFSTGRLLDARSASPPGMDVDELVAAVRDSGEEIAARCWRYFHENHETGPIVDRLKAIAKEAVDARTLALRFPFQDGVFKATAKKLLGRP
jgi:hypothetical protein